MGLKWGRRRDGFGGEVGWDERGGGGGDGDGGAWGGRWTRREDRGLSVGDVDEVFDFVDVGLGGLV